jgi:hypothetical protein
MASDAPVLSPNYAVVHLVYATVLVCVVLGVPQFLVQIKDPNAELLHNATDAYTVECYAFSARAIGYYGQTVCTSYTFGSACWDVFLSMQLQECSEPGVIFPAVAQELQEYGYLNDVFVVVVIVLCGTALGVLVLAYMLGSYRSTLLFLVALLHGMALFFSAALMASSALAVAAVSYNDNNNKGQTVHVTAGSVAAVVFPYVALFIDATPAAFVAESTV